MAMLEPGDILVDCTGSKSLLRDHLAPGATATTERREHAQHPPRVRARDHVPLRPAVRLQRVLQVLQERRERALQVHPGRRTARYYDGNVSHVTGIVTITRGRVRGDAAAVRRRVAPRQLPRRRRSRWTGSSTRSSRRPTARSSAIWRSSGSRSTSTGRGNATSRQWHADGPGDHPFATHAGLPARRLGDRLAVLPVDLAGLRVRDVPGGAHRAT